MLNLDELALFEEVTGVTWSRAERRFTPSFCQRHRLLITGCAGCRNVAQLCEEHLQGFRLCDECEAPDTPIKWLAAVAWLVLKREDPALGFAEYCAANGPAEAYATLKNANSGAAAIASPLKRRPGSRRSSTTTRA